MEFIRKYSLVIIFYCLLFIIHLYKNNKIECMTDIDKENIKKTIYEIYKSDISSINNLSIIARELQENVLTLPGNGLIKGKLDSSGNINTKNIIAGSINTKKINVENDITTKSIITNNLINPNITIDGNINVKGDGKNIMIKGTGHINANGDINAKGYITGKQNIARYIRVGNTDATLRQKQWFLTEIRVYDKDGNNMVVNKPVKIIQGTAATKATKQIPTAPDLYVELPFVFNEKNIVDNIIFNWQPKNEMFYRHGHEGRYTTSINNEERGFKGNIGITGQSGITELEIDLGSDRIISQIQLFNHSVVTHGYQNLMTGTVVKFVNSAGQITRTIYTGIWQNVFSKEYCF